VLEVQPTHPSSEELELLPVMLLEEADEVEDESQSPQ